MRNLVFQLSGLYFFRLFTVLQCDGDVPKKECVSFSRRMNIFGVRARCGAIVVTSPLLLRHTRLANLILLAVIFFPLYCCCALFTLFTTAVVDVVVVLVQRIHGEIN